MGKSFAAAISDARDEPIQFDLGPEAAFEVPRPLPGFAVARLASRAEDGGAKAIGAFLEFLEGVMDPDEFKRFSQVATEKRVDLETLIGIGTYVIEEGSGRPTAPSSGSAEP